MKNLVNSRKPQTDDAVGNLERSCASDCMERATTIETTLEIMEGSRVGASVPKREAPRTGEKIVCSLPKGRAVYYCRKCGERKIVPDDFYGANRICKECFKIRVLARQKTERGKIVHNRASAKHARTAKAKDRRKELRRTEIGRARNRRYIDSLRARHPEKMDARRQLRNAVRRGELLKPDACSRCGSVTQIHGHHEDYSKPLDVEWLCRKCHIDAHKAAETGTV